MNKEKVCRACSKEWMRRKYVERLIKVSNYKYKYVLNFAVFNFLKEFNKVRAI